MSSNASIAGRCFILHENGSIAAESVISMQDLEEKIMGAQLTEKQFERECGYRTSISIMDSLLENGLITKQEYRQIERILAQKFSPVWAGLSNVLKDKTA